MSENDTIIVQDESKSLDKKEIEDEEREKMLNAENKTIDDVQKIDSDMGEIIKPIDSVTEEGREVKPKFIPIGGIKMPGFFTRSKSKEKCKDSDDGAQGELLEKPAEEAVKDAKEIIDEKIASEPPTLKSRLSSIKITNPFAKKPKPSEDDIIKEPDAANTEAPPTKKGLLNAIRLPLVNMIPRKLRGQSGAPADTEVGLDNAKTAELASMETLDDNKSTEKIDIKSEDGMENVKLDIEDKVDSPAEKEKLSWRERIRQQKFIIDDLAIAGGIVVFILLVIIIIVVTSGGNLVSAPIKDGRFVSAVTSCGYVEGVLEDGAFAFRGIPYANPSIGENRWRSAQPLNKLDQCWNGTLKAHNATPECWQINAVGAQNGIEDCLTLDVVTPHVRYDTPLPVIVLIGSDSLNGGSPGKMRPSARYARSKDVLFVRPNFRIGVLGFLALNSLSKSTHPPTSGNYGLSDIIAALNWVQLNIKNFGGDPKSVTLFGHRAGATLVTALAAHKKAKNLFARIWVSSGSALYPGKPLEESQDINESYMGAVDCKDVTCLREANVTDIVNSVPDTWRADSPDLPSVLEEPGKRHEWLVLDGVIINTHLADALTSSTIPIVIGTTAHVSASQKLFLKHTEWTPEIVVKHVKDSKIGQLGLAEEALNKYNATYQGLTSMISDIRTVCPLLTLARRRPSIPFYVVTQPNNENNIADVDSDISAILGRYEPKTPEQRRYVAAMQQLFYHYVWHGEVPQADTTHNFFVLTVGQDVLATREYPNCDMWISKNVVPLYARQD